MKGSRPLMGATTNNQLVIPVYHSAQPFNMAYHEYVKMFERKPPQGLYSHLSLITISGTTDADADRENEKIDNSQYNKLLDQFLPDGVLCLQCTASVMSDVIAVPLPDAGISGSSRFKFQPDLNPADWICNGIYLQTGFAMMVDCPCDQRRQSITVAMLGYDIMVALTGSIEPRDHDSSLLQPINKQAWENMIQTTFSCECCLMCRDLRETRNKWLVFARAILMGRNPIVEWKRFRDAGGWYFLQYPHLCP